MKYITYLEVPSVQDSKGETYRTRLFHFDKATGTGNGGISGLNAAKSGRAPSIICSWGISYIEKGNKIKFPEMRLVTGYVPGEKTFISRYIFTLSDVEVDNIFSFNRTFSVNTAQAKVDAEEIAEANSIVKRNFLREVILHSAKVSFKQETVVGNYWRSLFTYTG